MLKNSARISKAMDSVMRVRFDIPKSVLMSPGPWKKRRLELPKVPRTVFSWKASGQEIPVSPVGIQFSRVDDGDRANAIRLVGIAASQRDIAVNPGGWRSETGGEAGDSVDRPTLREPFRRSAANYRSSRRLSNLRRYA